MKNVVRALLCAAVIAVSAAYVAPVGYAGQVMSAPVPGFDANVDIGDIDKALEYAKLALAAYTPDGNPAPPGWRLIDSSRMDPASTPDVQILFDPPANGYFGAAYQKISNPTEIVVAHRGTEDLTDWIIGNVPHVAGQRSPQFDSALAFAKGVSNKTGKQASQIIQVGHSLGGALSSLVGIATGAKVVNFDAHPIGQVVLLNVDKLYQTVNNIYQQDIVSIVVDNIPAIQYLAGRYDNQITGYRLAFDFVSVAGLPIGKSYTVPVPPGSIWDDMYNPDHFLLIPPNPVDATLARHDMERLVNTIATLSAMKVIRQRSFDAEAKKLGKQVVQWADWFANKQKQIVAEAGLAVARAADAVAAAAAPASRVRPPFPSAVCSITPAEAPVAIEGDLALVARPDGSVDQYAGSPITAPADPLGGPRRSVGGFDGDARKVPNMAGAVVVAVDVPFIAFETRSSFGRVARPAAGTANVAILKDGGITIWGNSMLLWDIPKKTFTGQEVLQRFAARPIDVQDGKFIFDNGTIRDGVIEHLVYDDEAMKKYYPSPSDANTTIMARRSMATDIDAATHLRTTVPIVHFLYTHDSQTEKDIPELCVRKVTRGHVLLQGGSVHTVDEPRLVIDTPKPVMTGVRDLAAARIDQGNQLYAPRANDGYSPVAVVVAKTDGTAWRWNAKYRQDGNRILTQPEAPQQIPGLANVVQVAASFTTLWFLHGDGHVSQWKFGERTQQGLVDNKPQPVPGLEKVIYIASNTQGNALIAQKADGSIMLHQWGAPAPIALQP